MKNKPEVTVASVGWAWEPPYKIAGAGKWVNVAGGYLISAAAAEKINHGHMGDWISAIACPLNGEEDTVVGKKGRVDFLIGPRY